MRTIKSATITLFCLFASLLLSAQWKGKFIYGYAGADIKQYDLSAKTDKVIFKDARQPFATTSGDIYFVNEQFKKRGALLRKSNASATQFRDVVDLSSENPLYKKSLDEYSVINHTGKSAVMSAMHNPKVSPNGKYLAVTILGYRDMVFDQDCVGVFDIATGTLVAKFEGKFSGTWTPDNRLVMAGAFKSDATSQSMYKSKTPGIFISDAQFSQTTRIDPDLDDPSPYHPAVSPDGKMIAYILNDHVWVMSIDGKNNRQLTAVDNDNSESFPTWSPDAKYLACWVYKTFERSYYTAIAVVPASSNKAVVLSNSAAVWPKDTREYRISGGNMQFSWVYDNPVTFSNVPTNQNNPGKKLPPAPPAPKTAAVGSLVSFKADDGKTYTGKITEISSGQYKVHYDGFDYEAWMTREQFELK